MTYQAMYKCRLCGETFERVGFYEECVGQAKAFSCYIKGNITLRNIMTDYNTMYTHSCADNSIGIADFQGFKAVKEDNC